VTCPDAVWLYGSVARGDDCKSSDVDILVIGDGAVPDTVADRFPGRRLSFSRYTWLEVTGMAAYGSLFLCHVKREALPLFEAPHAVGRLRAIVDHLPCYQRAPRDLRAFRQSLMDLTAELPDPPDLHFELATLAALVRRIGILGSYLLGTPRFDRLGPVAHVVGAWGLPKVFSDEFGTFYQYRLAADGVGGNARPDVAEFVLWTCRATQMLEALEVQISAERSLQEAVYPGTGDSGRSGASLCSTH